MLALHMYSWTQQLGRISMLMDGLHAGRMADPAILVFCYTRAAYLNQTVASLASLEGLRRFAVYVSQVGVPSSIVPKRTGICL